MPPQSVMNGLKLNQTDKELEEQGLSMEELEAALIAASETPRIAFAPSLDLFFVPSKSIIVLSIFDWSLIQYL